MAVCGVLHLNSGCVGTCAGAGKPAEIIIVHTYQPATRCYLESYNVQREIDIDIVY